MNAAAQEIVRECVEADFVQMLEIINDAAHAYKGVIPDDRWHEPYMSDTELQHEIDHGVIFWGLEIKGKLAGVMGIQDRGEVFLIRHAYVRTHLRQQGVGSRLLRHLETMADKPVLIGTWAAATWAVSFYQKNGYVLLGQEEKTRLLHQYWSIPERQVETSVVLADRKWQEGAGCIGAESGW